MHTVETHIIGSYNLDNVLAAVAVGRFFKIPAERISRAIAAYEPTNNRSQFKKTDNNELIIDAYNANPSSMKVALDNFITMPVQPKAIILGDMRELGPTSDELHRGGCRTDQERPVRQGVPLRRAFLQGRQRVLPLRYHGGNGGRASETAVKGLSYLDQRLS